MSPVDPANHPEVVDAVADLDPLAQIEQRVLRAVELVNSLRVERDALLVQLADARAAAAHADEAGHVAGQALSAEIAALKTERQQVRTRLERLLGHIDQLGNN